MVTRCWSVAILMVAGVAASGKPRENIEWSRMWWNQANDESLPRVLLIGDSITDGYQSLVTEELKDVAHVGYWATSKCVSDRSYLALLDYVLGEYKYAVIHFNNGLHSLDTDRDEWLAGLRAAFEHLRDKGQGAKIIWATSTPLRPADLTAKSRELNALAAPLAAEFGFATDDLFALMEPADRAVEWSDDFHFHEPARRRQAKQVADAIRALLPPPSRVTEGLHDGDFEGEGKEWHIYPDNPEAGALEMVTDTAHAGQRSAKVIARAQGLQFVQYAPPLTPGKSYTISFWAKADKAATVTSHLRTQRPPYTFIGDTKFDLTTDWQQCSYEVDLPADYDAAAYVFFINPGEPATYWFDDLQVQPK